MHYRVLSRVRSIARSFATSAALAGLLAVAVASSANAQKKYDPGATDTEIKIGNIMPYSGPASAYATIGKTEAAYFNKLNSEGGINGRKINFISYDDGYSPPKTVEQARKLVEADEVLLIFNPLGTPGNTAIQKYMNAKKVPQIFVSSGAAKWNDPKNFPWTIGWQPNYQTEARIYAAYILKNYPGKTIGVLYQNDDFGKDYVIGLRDGLGDQANKLIVMESLLRDLLADGRFPGRSDQERQSGHFHQHLDAEIRGAGDQENRRVEMDSGPLPHQRVGVCRQRDEAGRIRERPGHSHRGVSEGPEGPAVEKRCRQ